VRYLVGACCLALVAAGCGSGGKSSATTKPTTTNVTTTTTVTVSGRYRYSPKIIRSFMRSCTQGNAAKENYCACVLDKLSNSVSTRDFARIARTGKAVPRVARAIRRATASCKGTA
jgi:hypothetical protein